MSRKLYTQTALGLILSSTAVADVPSVAVDIAPVHALVARVMDGVGAPNLIIPPGASPHEYSLRPSEAQSLQDADIVFWIGEDLTPWLEKSIDTLSQNAEITTLLDQSETKLLKFREGALFEAHDHDDHDDHDEHNHDKSHDDRDDHDDHDHDKSHDDHDDHDDHDHDKSHDDHDDHDDHDHDKAHDDHDDHDDHDHDKAHDDHDDHDDHDHDKAHDDHDDHDDHDHDKSHDDHDDHEGHNHGTHDPHAWLSIDNAQSWLNVIAAKLSAVDPENAGVYYGNAASAIAELDAVEKEINATLDPVRGNSFVVFHDAYQYFENSFEFFAAGAISLSDASDPSAARIAEVQGRIKNEGIDCILSEPQYNANMVATVLSGTDAKTGVIDPLGSSLEPGPNLYTELVYDMAETLAGCLSDAKK